MATEHESKPIQSSLPEFSEASRQALIRAEEQAVCFNHNYIGTEHVLLGIVTGEDDDPVKAALKRLEIDINSLVSATEFVIGRGDTPPKSRFGLTPRGRKVIQYACEEAQKDQVLEVSTTHLLKGIIKEGENIAVQILEYLGISLETLSQEIAKPEYKLMSRLQAVFKNPNIDPAAKNYVREIVETALNFAEKTGSSPKTKV